MAAKKQASKREPVNFAVPEKHGKSVGSFVEQNGNRVKSSQIKTNAALEADATTKE